MAGQTATEADAASPAVTLFPTITAQHWRTAMHRARATQNDIARQIKNHMSNLNNYAQRRDAFLQSTEWRAIDAAPAVGALAFTAGYIAALEATADDLRNQTLSGAGRHMGVCTEDRRQTARPAPNFTTP